MRRMQNKINLYCVAFLSLIKCITRLFQNVQERLDSTQIVITIVRGKAGGGKERRERKE